MKRFKSQWLLAGGLLALGVGGIVSSNMGCGSSSNAADGGAGTSGGGGTGAAGHAGTTGAAGGVAPRLNYTFDNDKQLWALSTYPDTNYLNLGAATDPDSGVSLDGGAVPTLDFSSTDGDPAPGSLKLGVTFTGFKQYVDPYVNISPAVDLTNRIVHVRVRLVSGTFPAGGIQFHISSGLTPPNDYVYVSANFFNAANLTLGTWVTVPLDTSTISQPSNGKVFDPSQIVQVGIQFTTGDPFEGGTLNFGPAVFEIDTVQG